MHVSYAKIKGISLLEILLVLMLAVVGILLGFKQYLQFKRTQDFTQIQQSVNQLLQAGSAYYYATCTTDLIITPQQISLDNLAANGTLPNAQAVYNPRGRPFEVWIISGNSKASSGPPYLIQVRAYFAGNTTSIGEMAKLLDADEWTGGNTVTWTKLPSQVLKHISISVQSAGGWLPNVANIQQSAQAISSNLWTMNADLAKFSKDEAERARNATGQGFTCPD